MSRFQMVPAKREEIQLIIGLYGASKSGKTFSALRLAQGIHDVVGGKVVLINTEDGRGRHYADVFDYHIVDIAAPFNPLSYLDALRCAREGGATVAIVDQLSYEHEGAGGVLDMHENELQRMAGNDLKKREKCNFTAWIKPKRERQKLIQGMKSLGIHLIVNFRAQEKIKPVRGKPPKQLGWMPVGASDYAYECTLMALLTPGCGGVPTWQPDDEGSKMLSALPAQFRSLANVRAPLDEKCGAWLARWAVGDDDARTANAAAETPPVSWSPAIGTAPNGIRWTEWRRQDDIWIGEWYDPDGDTAGKLAVAQNGTPYPSHPDPCPAATEAAEWAWQPEADEPRTGGARG